ncbi:hypothetical protein D3C81_1977290 [compost metagenome]
MRRFITPRSVPVGAVEALNALEQQAIRLAVNPQHPFVAQQFVGKREQQIFHHAGHGADIDRIIQLDHDGGDVVLLIADKVEAWF